MERYVPGSAKPVQPPPQRQRKVARAATTYRAAKRNAMKVVRKYTPKAERHKVAV